MLYVVKSSDVEQQETWIVGSRDEDALIYEKQFSKVGTLIEIYRYNYRPVRWYSTHVASGCVLDFEQTGLSA
jgi:hypothetical protein